MVELYGFLAWLLAFTIMFVIPVYIGSKIVNRILWGPRDQW